MFRSGTDLAWALYRTQLFSADDIAAVQAVQAGYEVEPLSAFLGVDGTACGGARHRFHGPADTRRAALVARFFDVIQLRSAVCAS